MRLTDLPVIGEVKDEYISIRQDGKSRSEATKELCGTYENELQDEDDAMLFWIGLADGQTSCQEITQEIAEKALRSLKRLEGTEWQIARQDILQRMQKYSKAPMPERKQIKPKKKYCCQWTIGDTYAYQIQANGEKAADLSGKFALLRKVADVNLWDKSVVPAVTISIWPSLPFPQSVMEFQNVPVLKLNMGKMEMLPGQIEYRAALIIQNKRQLESMPLVYVGNFDAVLPENEKVYENPAYMAQLLPQLLESKVITFWKRHNYYTEQGY